MIAPQITPFALNDAPTEDRRAPRDERLTMALERYAAAIDAGHPLSKDELLTQFADVADELRGCLDSLDFIHQIAPQLGDGATARLPSSSDHPTSSPQSPAPSPQPGILGDFRIIHELGRGGMGVVYEAEQLSLGRRIALKVLPFAAMLDRQQLARFKNEARAAATLDHPNIVAIYSVGCERGVHYYAMQLIEGQSLAEAIAQLRAGSHPQAGTRHGAGSEKQVSSPPLHVEGLGEGCRDTVAAAHLPTQLAPRSSLLDPSCRDFYRTIARLCIQAAEALDHAHQGGILHRDIKPANLLVDDAGKLWVTDFGLARIEQDAGMTMTGDLLGTLRYMSPEQALAKRVVVDHRSDIYSLGVTLYELLTLQPAFPADDRHELLRQIAFDEPRKLRHINGRIPQDLETIVLKAIEKNPAQRYANAHDLADDMRRYLDHEPIKAKPPTWRNRIQKWSRRHPVGVRTTGLAALAAAVVVAASVGWITRDRAARQALLAQQANLALDEANTLYDADKVNEALSAVKRAEGLLASGEGDNRLMENMRQRRADFEVVQHLDQIATNRDGDDTEKAYREAFLNYGIDIRNGTPVEIAQLIQKSPVKQKLIAALDSWSLGAWVYIGTDNEGSSIDKRLIAIARLADPDPWRDRLRDAVDREDGTGLKELASDPEALKQRPDTVLLLARSLIAHRWNDRAIVLLEQTQQLYPAHFLLNMQLAASLRGAETPKTLEAIGFTRAAIAARPDSGLAHESLAVQLGSDGRLDAAEAEIRTAIRLRPKSGLDYYNLAHLLLLRGRRVEAAALLRDAPRPVQDGDFVQYATVLMQFGRFADAEVACRAALQLTPKNSNAYVLLGRSLAGQQKYRDAIAAWEQAIELKKGDRELEQVNNELAWFLATSPDDGVRDGKRAVELAMRACELTDHKEAGYIDTLAAAYAEAGDFEAAVENSSKALELAQSSALRDDLKKHLESFQSRTPWREKPEVSTESSTAAESAARAGRSDGANLNPLAPSTSAEFLAAQGRFHEAAQQFAAVFQKNPDDNSSALRSAMLSLISDDRDAYQAMCGQMLDRFAATDDPEALRRTCWAGLISNPPVGDLDVLLLLADRAMQNSPVPSLSCRERGLAAYRAADWHGALKWCAQSRSHARNRDDYIAQNLLMEAMALHQLGRTSEAKSTYNDAVKHRQTVFPDDVAGSKFIGPRWLDWVDIEILNREAAALIGVRNDK